MVGLADDVDLLPGDALQVLHGADGDPLEIEHRPLLDVQFDEGGRTDATQRCRTGVADAGQLLAQHGAVDRARGKRLVQRQPARVDQRAEHVGCKARALLVGEESHHQRPLGADTGVIERSDDLEPGEHPVVAVIGAAGTHGVDVRAGHHRRQIGPTPGAQAEDVANGVDRHLQAELAHPADDEIAAAAVVVGERQPAARTGSGAANVGQRRQAREQARAIGLDARGLGDCRHASTSSADLPTTSR